MLHKDWNSKGEMLYCFPRSSIKFQGHTVQNITDFDPNWAFSDYRPVAAFKSLRFALLYICLSDSLTVTPRHHPLKLYWDWNIRRELGPYHSIKTIFPRYGIPMLKSRRSWDRLIFNIGIPRLVRRHLFYGSGHETAAVLSPGFAINW